MIFLFNSIRYNYVYIYQKHRNMIRKNVYSILGILSPFIGLFLVNLEFLPSSFDFATWTLMTFFILGICFSVISLYKKERKILSFIALIINIAPILFLVFIFAPSLKGFGVIGH